MMKNTLCMIAAVVLLSLEVGWCKEVRTTGGQDASAAGGQNYQTQRVRSMLKSGKLSKQEAKALRKENSEIQKMKKEAKADGVVTPQERKAIMDKMKALKKRQM